MNYGNKIDEHTLFLLSAKYGIKDATSKCTVENNRLSLSTTQKKYNSQSFYSSTSWSSTSFCWVNCSLPTTEWTIEWWEYPISWSSEYPTPWAYEPAKLSTTNNTWIEYGPSPYFSVDGTTNTFSRHAAGSWYHFAMVRKGNNFVLYRNGSQISSLTKSTTHSLSWITIGIWTGGMNYYYGYFDDFRVSDVARYTTNFSPPTKAFTILRGSNPR